ncbi:hypothetical protein AB0K60_20810 [Thermopolyspora sp. NPDC052614]|uniref:hypothetical protein n=1 Tax=Thermopolyspora sp. NPDC052614 TaxID=3155682 RepID=UPI003444ABE1
MLTGVLGIASELFRHVIGMGYSVYGFLLFVWFIAVGWHLYRLGRDAIPEPVDTCGNAAG